MSWAQAAGTLLSSYSSAQSGGGGGGGGGSIETERTLQTQNNPAPFVFQTGGGNSGLTTWQWIALGGGVLGGLWILTSGGK